MDIQAYITIGIILGAIVLFVTELVSIDLVAILIMVSLMIFGIISPEEGVAGFSNSATITVAFMFVLSAALLKTGALQHLTYSLSKTFKKNFKLGMGLMIGLIALISAFVNNTPVVAVFIPVVIQIGYSSGISPAKMLIPLSFASIFGGSCTLIGSSTNILVHGIAQREGLEGFGMFQLAPLGLVLVTVGIIYLVVIGIRLLPNRKPQELSEKFGTRDYLMEIELTEEDSSIGKMIMHSDLVQELSMDIIEVRRGKNIFNLPQGDFVLRPSDVLKIRCDRENIKLLKDRVKLLTGSPLKIDGDNLKGRNSTLVELVVTSNSEFEAKTLKEVDFRRRFRSVPLAIRHREEILHNNLYDTRIKAGDVILAETKNHFLNELRKMDGQRRNPFFILSEDLLVDFKKKRFYLVASVIFAMVALAALNILPIMVGAISAVAVLVLTKTMSMKNVYEAINWKIIFLLAGALTLGTAMKNTGLDVTIAGLLIDNLGVWGPIAILSGLYITTSWLTELMSNNATAALLAPIAIQTAEAMNLSPVPFLIAITFAASASFMTPVGYQTNTMVYSAGNYKFLDFVKVGFLLNIIFWLTATFLIPIFYPF
ncbi:MAG: SLC13 family permease [bacterium]|nr:SLC13 family permease [bacterium]